MAKMRISFCVCFWLCCFAASVFCSSELDEFETRTEKPVQTLEGLFSHVQILENRIQELEKSREECKLLRKEVDEMKTQARKDGGVWFLTPRLRGPPGNKGEAGSKGEIGLIGQDGKPGASGEKGEKGLVGPVGPKGVTGQQGVKGQQGTTGSKGDRGISVHSSCSAAMKILPPPRLPKQWIYPHGNGNSKIIEVLCDFENDNGGWTIIQKRSSGPQDEFYRGWSEYANGFGSLDGNFWLGLDNIRALAKNGDQELRIEVEDFEGNKRFAKYSRFSISDASDFYRLSVGGFFGNSTAGDSMTNSVYNSGHMVNGMRFSTKDNDNGCVKSWGGGGWWFDPECYSGYSHLNGPYQKNTWPKGIHWISWKSTESLAKTEMKIHTRK